MTENNEETPVEATSTGGLKTAFEKAMETPIAPIEDTPVADSEVKKIEVQDRQDMTWPLPVYPLVAKFDVQPVDLEDGEKAIVLAIYTGAGSTFGLLSRDGARALASVLKKTANS
jgi:hypothetical protein